MPISVAPMKMGATAASGAKQVTAAETHHSRATKSWARQRRIWLLTKLATPRKHSMAATKVWDSALAAEAHALRSKNIIRATPTAFQTEIIDRDSVVIGIPRFFFA